MNYTNVQSGLSEYDKVKVGIFINYLREVETAKDKQQQLKNKWFHYFKDEQAISLYKQVAIDEGMFIDGDTITIQFKGKVMVSYNYQAYKNKLLTIYPESKFDIQNVYQGDSFTFKKESGRVLYTHELADPFSETAKTIIGCYCIIKNSRGEFIETLNKTEIQKMRNVAKTQKIWNAWESEMTLKSVMKRACKRHFKDLVVNIELIDNENYEPETVEIKSNVKDLIENCVTLEDLQLVYDEQKDKQTDQATFMSLLGTRKSEIKLELQKAATDGDS